MEQLTKFTKNMVYTTLGMQKTTTKRSVQAFDDLPAGISDLNLSQSASIFSQSTNFKVRSNQNVESALGGDDDTASRAS